MKKAIATPHGQPTRYIELTPKETDARNAEIERAGIKALKQKPFDEIKRIEATYTSNPRRQVEFEKEGEGLINPETFKFPKEGETGVVYSTWYHAALVEQRAIIEAHKVEGE